MIRLSERAYDAFFVELRKQHPGIEMATLTSEAISFCNNTESEFEIVDGTMMLLEGRILGITNSDNSIYEFVCNDLTINVLIQSTKRIGPLLIRGAYRGDNLIKFSQCRKFDVIVDTEVYYVRYLMGLLDWTPEQCKQAFSKGSVVGYNSMRNTHA